MSQLLEKKNLIGLVMILFGVLTVLSGGRALFIESGISSRGNIVPVVLWFNFIAGFFYIIAGISTVRLKVCVKRLTFVLATLSLLVLLYLISHIMQGGLYETKTLVAMSFRASFWVFFAIYFQKSDFFKKIECHC